MWIFYFAPDERELQAEPIRKIAAYQAALLFDEKIIAKMRAVAEGREIIAYQQVMFSDDYWLIVLADDGVYEMWHCEGNFKTPITNFEAAFFAKPRRYHTRRSAWTMATERWNWRSFDDIEPMLWWIEDNTPPDRGVRQVGTPYEDAWCGVYDRGIFAERRC